MQNKIWKINKWGQRVMEVQIRKMGVRQKNPKINKRGRGLLFGTEEYVTTNVTRLDLLCLVLLFLY